MQLFKSAFVGIICFLAAGRLAQSSTTSNSEAQININVTDSTQFHSAKLTKKSKILISLGFGTRSHIKALLEISKVLESRGHSITYASIADHEKFNKGFDFPYLNLGGEGTSKDLMREKMSTFSAKKKLDMLPIISKLFPVSFGENYQICYPKLDKFVKENRPDLIMCDFFAHACKDVAEMNGIPLVIGVQVTDAFGIAQTSYTTNSMEYAPITIDQLSFPQRLYDTIYLPLKGMYYFYPFLNKINSIRASFGVPPSYTPFGEFTKNLVLSSTFEGFEVASPIQPNLKMVGPIVSEEIEKLDSDLETFLDERKNVMYVAFGSQFILAKFDLENIIVASLKALESGHIDGIIWGLANTLPSDFPEFVELNGKQMPTSSLFDQDHPNFRLLSWAPQLAILNHNNVKLFISHGGLDSTMEGLYTGTPILSMAAFGDQPRNAKKLENLGVGFYIDRITTTPDIISGLIAKIIEDQDGHIKANVLKLKVMAHAGSQRKGLAANYVEEYIEVSKICRTIKPYKYGEIPCEIEHLVPVSQNMFFIVSNKLDVYLATLTILLVAASITIFSLRALLFLVVSRFPTKVSTAKKVQ